MTRLRRLALIGVAVVLVVELVVYCTVCGFMDLLED
jgi:hypothetical protein